MPIVAKAPVNQLVAEGHKFEFADGSRQVTQEEQKILRRYATNADISIDFEETKAKGGKS